MEGEGDGREGGKKSRNIPPSILAYDP